MQRRASLLRSVDCRHGEQTSYSSAIPTTRLALQRRASSWRSWLPLRARTAPSSSMTPPMPSTSLTQSGHSPSLRSQVRHLSSFPPIGWSNRLALSLRQSYYSHASGWPALEAAGRMLLKMHRESFIVSARCLAMYVHILQAQSCYHRCMHCAEVFPYPVPQ